MDILSPINTAIWNSHFLDANAVEFEPNHCTQIHSCRLHYSRIVWVVILAVKLSLNRQGIYTGLTFLHD